MMVTDLDGRYGVVSLPPATYCTLTVTNLFHGNGANEADEEENTQGFLKQETDDQAQEWDVDGVVDNKDYSTLLSVGTLQSANCVLIQYNQLNAAMDGAEANSATWAGFYPELRPDEKLQL
mmetsp:Transcript_30954/g.23025  ORF Transcript_30954/g.23025 Transcript_30954/m.23025 type:complete len:121 (-) Transcript_30954:185-547(-)|eukprot:CAMPEP_0202962986 /NCGR_PEP_ID=MMETSP1396-20130829/6993_1 /ASSEMBLY_ACC=CAM_ASM_000872 /TAXON_ID= /ORGANISM="Pseudokeronopsis sp., Strain Brazil" /LENGTH=120 /DNA_ID=CAMNT_0049683861 /DNA_START=319 /DNA_END=681 /DNA_ORIENTATION=-